ncbi:SGNH/GDSL hydrolase family protein [Cupriavidus necator]|uniref:SGNH/GDSL hydrolase family protein n=1 Tax=Cupriavidus necator TaxID=106590 RepID=UPI00148F67FF|nr:SGNH/GDSL hydrolase family protein [Cupriavidus necator]NOV28003.1 SGNH/GDSL hydrolase family protein [Cupriavidus necator]
MGILDAPFRESRVQRWARRFDGVGSRYPVMASPPTVTMQGNASTINANTAGNVSHRFDNDALTHIGNAVINDGTNRGVGSSITFADSSKQASNSPIRTRFVTDAPAFEAVFRGTQFAAVSAIVDGEYIARARLAVFPNDGNPHYVKFDFGTNTRTYTLAQVSKNAGGSGYAVGDQITLAGGTFSTAAVVTVIQVSSGAISAIEVSNQGAYSVSTTTFTQGSTTGSGTGATFNGPVWSAQFTQRKMRRIELIWHGSGQKLYGINVDNQSTVLPYAVPALAPKIAFVGDSITNGTYLDYAGAHIGLSIGQRLGLADRAEINAIGGSGWATVNTTVTPNGPAWNDAKRVADFIALDADIYVWWGSQNDAAAGSSVVTAAVQSVLSQVSAAVPKAIHIGLGPINVSGTPGTDLSTAVGAGFAAMGNASRFRYIDSTAENWLSGTGKVTGETTTGNKDFYLSSDNAHPDQAGLDYLAYQASVRIADTICQMVGT